MVLFRYASSRIPTWLPALAFVLLPVFAIAQPGVPESDKGEIFVSDIVDSGGTIEPALLEYFSEVVRDGARKYATGYRLMDRENADVILEGYGLTVQQCFAEGRNDCEVGFGRRLQAEIVVSGQILSMSNGSARVILKMFDVARSEPISSKIGSAAGVDQIEVVLTELLPEFFRPLFRPDAAVEAVKLPPPDPNAGRGHLYVISDPPGAQITLNGKAMGQATPFLFEDLAVGWYRIELESPISKVQKVVNLVPNDITRTTIPMTNNKQGSLLLETTPPGLHVILDGRDIGVSPQFVPALSAGEHKVNVSGKLDGKVWSLKQDASVNIEAGRRNRFNIRAMSKAELSKDRTRTFNQKLDVRRTRASFQTRLSGGIDLNRAKYGVSGLVQIGVGTCRWFDIHTGVGFPGYIWVTDFEVNIWPHGRFVPTIGVEVGLGFDPDHEYYSLVLHAGVEFWILDWLAAFVKIGVGGGWNLDTDRDGVIVPGWVGIEARY